jgi:hypothetical protein
MQAERKREMVAGGVMALLGLGAAVKGSSYSIGTLADMGPGLFPVMVGGALVVVGGLIALSSPAPGSAHGAPVTFDKRVWICLLGGAALFIVLAAYAGLLPAIFLSVLVTAWADRTTTWRGSLILSACVSGFGIALFTYVLHVQIPVLQGF